MPLVKPSVPKEYWALAALLLLAVFFASPGFVSFDEAILYLGARAIAEHGTLGMDTNGYAQFHSESLKLRFLIDGPQGLTPQYPAGSSLLAAPLLDLFGPRAFMLLNALAAIGLLFTVRNICLSQFNSERIARIAIALMVFGTFWLEYAVGVWPHMLSSYFALQAYWFALRHLDRGGKGYREAMLSGLFAGAGILFRLDAALAVPAIGLMMVMFAPRFVRTCVLFGAGVLPSLVLLSVLNYLKFGSPNPFSYGQSGGNTDLAAYGPFFAVLCVGFGALVVWRRFEWRIDIKVAIGSFVVLGAALLLIPATNALLLRIWSGFLALVVDARNIEDHRFGVDRGPGNTLVAWGQVKKSLGQSMPWIGLTAILLTNGFPKGDRRSFAMLLIFVAAMILPFILLSWHGGGGNNMRYFLPAVPALCIICAKLLHDLWRRVPNGIIFVAASIWATLALSLFWVFLHPSGFAGVQQIFSTYVLLATALSAMAAGASWRFRQVGRGLTLALFAGGFVMSTAFALSDLGSSVERRKSNHAGRLMLEALPAKSLAIAYAAWVGDRTPGNGNIIAVRDELTRQIDRRLIVNALKEGYRVFIVSYEFDAQRDLPSGVEPLATGYTYSGGRLIELKRVAELSGAEHSRASK